MKSILKSLGGIGIFLWVIAFFYYLVKAKGDMISWGLLGGGTLLIGIYVYLFYGDLKKWFQWKRSTSYQFNALFLISIVFGILAVINFMGFRHHKRFDFTQGKQFSLAPQSIKVIKALKEEVKLIGFFKAQEKPLFDELVDKYKYHSDKIKIVFVDPDKDVARAKQYGVKQYQTVVVEKGKREKRVEGISEEKLTNAIIQVGREKVPTVYFLKGHDEKSITDLEREGYSQAKEELKGEGYEIKELSLIETGNIPDDSDALVIAGPQKPFFQKEIELISNYLKKGGRAFILLDPENKKVGIESLLSQIGVTAEELTIVDPVSAMFGQSAATPMVYNYSAHTIVKDVKNPSFFPLARSLTVAEKLPLKNIKVEPLAVTEPTSWGEIGILKSGEIEFNPGKDKKGPLNVGVCAFGKWDEDSKEEMRLVVFGDSDFSNNRSLGFSGNGDVFLNSIAWLVEDETSISIRPKEASVGRLMLTRAQIRFIFLLNVVMVPLLILGSGVWIWWRRKKVA